MGYGADRNPCCVPGGVKAWEGLRVDVTRTPAGAVSANRIRELVQGEGPGIFVIRGLRPRACPRAEIPV